MIVTKRQAYEEVALLMSDIFSKKSKDEAKSYRDYLSSKGMDEIFMMKNQKAVPAIASDLYKIADTTETKAYTDSLSIETKTALISRFFIFLDELDKMRYKKIEFPYSRNLRLKLILIDFCHGSSRIEVKHRL